MCGGGSDNNSSLNTGGIYDPITDSWKDTSIGINNPINRYRHTAIWSGNEMIVWGGLNDSSLNTGGRYDPIADIWQPTTLGDNVPSIRTGHTAVWDGNEMMIWGGL